MPSKQAPQRVPPRGALFLFLARMRWPVVTLIRMSDATSGFTVEQPLWDELSAAASAAGARGPPSRADDPLSPRPPASRRAGDPRGLAAGGPVSPLPSGARLRDALHPGRRPLLDRGISRSPLRITREENGDIAISTGGSRTRLVADGVPVARGGAPSPASEVERGVVLELADRVVLLLHTSRRQPLPRSRQLRPDRRERGARCACATRSAGWPTSTCPCCSAARPAPARSWWPAPSTRPARAATAPACR